MAIHFLPLMPYFCADATQPPYFLPRYSATSVTSTHFCGNRCGSEYRPQNMSGPAPVLAATEALGCTSSYDSREIVTFTPVAWVNASISFTNWSSSDCTKYFQRNSDSAALFSGFQGAVCAQALAQSSKAGPVRAPAAASAVPLPTSARRVIIVIDVPPFVFSSSEPLPRSGIEQMHEPGVGFEPDL